MQATVTKLRLIVYKNKKEGLHRVLDQWASHDPKMVGHCLPWNSFNMLMPESKKMLCTLLQNGLRSSAPIAIVFKDGRPLLAMKFFQYVDAWVWKDAVHTIA